MIKISNELLCLSLISYQTLCFLNSENILLRLITKKKYEKENCVGN